MCLALPVMAWGCNTGLLSVVNPSSLDSKTHSYSETKQSFFLGRVYTRLLTIPTVCEQYVRVNLFVFIIGENVFENSCNFTIYDDWIRCTSLGGSAHWPWLTCLCKSWWQHGLWNWVANNCRFFRHMFPVWSAVNTGVHWRLLLWEYVHMDKLYCGSLIEIRRDLFQFMKNGSFVRIGQYSISCCTWPKNRPKRVGKVSQIQFRVPVTMRNCVFL